MIVGAYSNTPVHGTYRNTPLQGEEMTEDERYYLVCPLRKNVGTRIPVTLCHRDKCFFLISKDGKFACDYEGIQKKPRGVPRGVGEAATPQGQTPQGKQTTPQGKGTEWK